MQWHKKTILMWEILMWETWILMLSSSNGQDGFHSSFGKSAHGSTTCPQQFPVCVVIHGSGIYIGRYSQLLPPLQCFRKITFFRILEFLCLKLCIFSFREEGIFVHYREDKATQSIQTGLWTTSVYFWCPMAVGLHLSLMVILYLRFSCFFVQITIPFIFYWSFQMLCYVI